MALLLIVHINIPQFTSKVYILYQQSILCFTKKIYRKYNLYMYAVVTHLSKLVVDEAISQKDRQEIV